MIYGWKTGDAIIVGAADTFDELVEYRSSLPQGATRLDIAVLKTVYKDCLIVPVIIDQTIVTLPPIEIRDRTEIVAMQMRLVLDTDDLAGIARKPTNRERLGLSKSDPWEKARVARGAKPHEPRVADPAQQAYADRIMQEVAEHGAPKTSGRIIFALGKTPIKPNEFEAMVFFVDKAFVDHPNERATIFDPPNLPEALIKSAPGIYRFDKTNLDDALAILIGLGFHYDPHIREVFEATGKHVERGRALEGPWKRFYRFDVPRTSLSDLEASETHIDAIYTATASGYGDTSDGAWFAFRSEPLAINYRLALVATGLNVGSVYPVDPDNKAIIEAPLRPWTDPDAFEALNAADKSALHSAAQAEEFLAAQADIDPERRTCRIAIVPRSFYATDRKLFPEPLVIDHLLPPSLGLKQTDPGLYVSTSADWGIIENELMNRQGFYSNMLFTAYARSL